MINFFKKHFRLRYQNTYIHAKKLFIFDIGLLILALFMLSASVFFFFWKPTLTDLVDVKFSFGGERLTSGEDMTVSINYKNRSKHTLKNTELAIHLPVGFVINRQKTPVAEFSEQSIFSLNDIKAGASGQLQIHGILYAEPGVDNDIIGYLTYIPEEKTTKEQKRSSSIIRVADSVLKLEITLPDKTFPGAKMPVTIKIQNNGQYKLDKINLDTFWNTAFTPENTKDLTLEANQTKEFNGTITAPNEAGEYNFSGLLTASINNQTITQANFSQKFMVYYPNLGISAYLKDENRAYLEPSDTVPMVISWQNKSEFDLQNLIITLTPEPGAVNLTATARENNLKVSQNTLIIDKKSRTALGNGSPGGKDDFEINLILSPSFSGLTGKNLKFKVKAQISAQISGISDQTFTRDIETNEIPLASELTLNSEVRYFTPGGDQIGRGPLPPMVGEETKYWLINRIYVGTNDVSDLYFTVKLADGVKMAEKQSVTLGKKMIYDANQNTITWNFDNAPAGGEISLSFEISVTPDESQVGKNIKLADSIDFKATDATVGKEFNLSQKNIFNILQTDDKGYKSGAKVVK